MNWTKDMVEKAIIYFNDSNRVPEDDEEKMRALVHDFVRFEQVVKQGKVERDAALLAKEFVKFAHEWFGKNPKYQAVYQDMVSVVAQS